MLITRTFNKQAPVVNGAIFEFLGVPSSGVTVSIENQHTANTLVYSFEESDDRTTWTKIDFENDDSSHEFALLSGRQATAHVTPDKKHLRLMGYGDLSMAISVANYEASPVTTATVTLL